MRVAVAHYVEEIHRAYVAQVAGSSGRRPRPDAATGAWALTVARGGGAELHVLATRRLLGPCRSHEVELRRRWRGCLDAELLETGRADELRADRRARTGHLFY